MICVFMPSRPGRELSKEGEANEPAYRIEDKGNLASRGKNAGLEIPGSYGKPGPRIKGGLDS
jgi:hypothetical protein